MVLWSTKAINAMFSSEDQAKIGPIIVEGKKRFLDCFVQFTLMCPEKLTSITEDTWKRSLDMMPGQANIDVPRDYYDLCTPFHSNSENIKLKLMVLKSSYPELVTCSFDQPEMQLFSHYLKYVNRIRKRKFNEACGVICSTLSSICEMSFRTLSGFCAFVSSVMMSHFLDPIEIDSRVPVSV